VASDKETRRLAIDGGPKAVTHSGEDRWEPIPVAEAKAAIGELLDQGVYPVGGDFLSADMLLNEMNRFGVADALVVCVAAMEFDVDLGDRSFPGPTRRTSAVRTRASGPCLYQLLCADQSSPT